MALCRSLKVGDVGLSRGLIGADGPERLQVVGHYGVGDIDGGSLRGNLHLSGNASGAVAGDYVGGIRNANLLVRGCGSLSRIRGIEPAHRIAIGVRDLLQQQQVRSRRQKSRIEHPWSENHLMREFVLLLCDVVGLQRCRGDFDGVGEDLLALLNLPGFVGDGLFFVFDLRNGMTRLRRIEDDAGTELRLRCGLECRHESDGECGED